MFTARPFERDWSDIAQCCPQTMQYFPYCAIKIKLFLIHSIYCTTFQYGPQTVNIAIRNIAQWYWPSRGRIRHLQLNSKRSQNWETNYNRKTNLRISAWRFITSKHLNAFPHRKGILCTSRQRYKTSKLLSFSKQVKKRLLFFFTAVPNLCIIMQRRRTGNYKSCLVNFYEKDS
jgi:hypothetical protein